MSLSEASAAAGAHSPGSSRDPERIGGALSALTREIAALRKTVAGDGEAVQRQLERQVRDLSESLEEEESDNAVLRLENQALRTAQEQITRRLESNSLGSELAGAGPHLSVAALQLRLAEAERQAALAHSVLRAIDRSRAYRLVHLYWTWARRLGRRRQVAEP